VGRTGFGTRSVRTSRCAERRRGRFRNWPVTPTSPRCAVHAL